VQVEEEQHLPAMPVLNGSWERKHRSSTAAAFIGLLIIGVLYFHAQAIFSGILLMADAVQNHATMHGKTFVEQLTHMAMAMKGPMRIAVCGSQFICMLLPVLWIVKHWHSSHVAAYIRFRRIPVFEIILAVAVTLCVFPLNEAIGEFFVERLHIPDFLSRINAQTFTSYTRNELCWLLFVVCLTPALCEEIFFRGYFQRTLERALGVKSIFVAGVMFGLFHMQPINLLSLSLLGILFGFFFYRSKSLFPGMAAHCTNNLCAVLSLYKTPDDRTALELFTYRPTWLGVLVAMGIAGVLLTAYYLTTRQMPEGNS